jgi:hypothetical protein
MRLRFGIVLAVVVLLALTSAVVARPRHLSLDLHALNDSGQTGTATIAKTSGGQLVVTIALNGEPGRCHRTGTYSPGYVRKC